MADQIRSPLLVLYPVLEELGAYLYHDIEFAHIQGGLPSEPDLYVARLLRPGRRVLWAFDRFANNGRQ